MLGNGCRLHLVTRVGANAVPRTWGMYGLRSGKKASDRVYMASGRVSTADVRKYVVWVHQAHPAATGVVAPVVTECT